MIGICGAVEVGLVAGVAGDWRVCVVVVDVALDAGKRGVFAGERVVCVERVVKGCVGPGRRGVASVAGVRQAELQVR